MNTDSYLSRREQLTTYFDRTAAKAWQALTSDAPVNRIRQTVRAGRDAMRTQLLAWLPADLRGKRILDAGCGTGSFAVEAARRGARVVAVDVAGSLVEEAGRRLPADVDAEQIDFVVGDMCSDSFGRFDYIVAMDSLIHYSPEDSIASITALARRANDAVLFTIAPHTVPLAMMHVVGRMIPHRSNRAPSIVPVRPDRLCRDLGSAMSADGWKFNRSQRISSGFYISQAMEFRKTCDA